jgi:HSP20 family protein
MNKKMPWWRKPKNDKKENEEDKSVGDEVKSEDQQDINRPPTRRPFDPSPGNPSPIDPGPFRADIDDIFNNFFSRNRTPFGLGDELFMNFDREFGEMHERMDELFKQTMEGKLGKPGAGGPFVYGFSMHTGPDGKPHVQEFSNMPNENDMRIRNCKSEPNTLPLSCSGETGEACGMSDRPKTERKTQRKPLTDIMECNNHISVTFELPGVEKKDIHLEILDNALEVLVETPKREFYNKLPLSGEVDPKTISASFKNGVLEVCVKRASQKKKKGKQVNIE